MFSLTPEQLAAAEQAVRSFGYSHYSLDDIESALRDFPGSQDWVPALALAVATAVVDAGARDDPSFAIMVDRVTCQMFASHGLAALDAARRAELVVAVANVVFQRMPPDVRDQQLAKILQNLDRCMHGRHKGEPCFGCPDGQSAGNPHLPAPGEVVGYGHGGQPYVVPEGSFSDPSGWLDRHERVSDES